MSNSKPIKPLKKMMLINATEKEELRVALIEGQKIYNLDRELMSSDANKGKKGDIFYARVENIESSLEAAFVDYGAGKHGFLPLKEINPELFKTDPNNPKARPHIRDVLKQGQYILVQIEKEERGNKGAALTNRISLAGSYIVLKPNSRTNNRKKGGISRRVEGEEREELKDAIHELNLPEGMSVIIRTAGVGRSAEELQWDLDILLTLWNSIQEAAQQRPAPYLIYQESDVIIRAFRDYLRPDISEILIDSPEAFEQAKQHLTHVRPDFVKRLKLYSDPIPLFSRYQIEKEIESAHSRQVELDNGASIVIDLTEALTAIDVNSSKATEGSDIEETALKTNIAAAKEIARQLRLRDLGGLIVIDFIDMTALKNQRIVENVLKEELKTDRARTRVGRLSAFGLLEMSRQRLRPSLRDSTQISCPRCEGQGSLRSVPSLALALLRVIEAEAMKEHAAQLRIQVPVDIGTFLINEKRDALIALEHLHKVHIMILPNPEFLTPHYTIVPVRKEELAFREGKEEASYQLTSKLAKTEEAPLSFAKKSPYAEPAIKALPPVSAARGMSGSQDAGILRRLWSAIFGGPAAHSSVSHTPSHTRTQEPGHYTQHNTNAGRSGAQRSSTKELRDRDRDNRNRNKDTRRTHESRTVRPERSDRFERTDRAERPEHIDAREITEHQGAHSAPQGGGQRSPRRGSQQQSGGNRKGPSQKNMHRHDQGHQTHQGYSSQAHDFDHQRKFDDESVHTEHTDHKVHRDHRDHGETKEHREFKGHTEYAHSHNTGHATHANTNEEVAASSHMHAPALGETASSPVVSHEPNPAAKTVNKGINPRLRTSSRPLRQSAHHPENINKMQGSTSAAAHAGSASSAASYAAPYTAFAKHETVQAPAHHPATVVPVMPGPHSAPQSHAENKESCAQNSRRNSTRFAKLSEQEAQANVITVSDEERNALEQEKMRHREALKQVQSKQHSQEPKKVEPIQISTEFITDDFGDDKK